MMYLVSTSAAFLPDEGRGYPGVWPRRPAILKGAMTLSSSHNLCFSHSWVGGVAKPFGDEPRLVIRLGMNPLQQRLRAILILRIVRNDVREVGVHGELAGRAFGQ